MIGDILRRINGTHSMLHVALAVWAHLSPPQDYRVVCPNCLRRQTVYGVRRTDSFEAVLSAHRWQLMRGTLVCEGCRRSKTRHRKCGQQQRYRR